MEGSDDEWVPHNRLKPFFDEFFSADPVEPESLEEMALGGVMFADGAVLPEFERLLHRDAASGMPAVEYVSKFFGKPVYDNDVVGEALARDVARVWPTVFPHRAAEEDCAFLIDSFFAMLTPEGSPRAHRGSDCESHYRRAVRSMVDAYDANSQLYGECIEQVRMHLRRAHDCGGAKDQVIMERVHDRVPYFSLCLARILEDEGYEDMAGMFIRDVVEQDVADDVGLAAIRGRLHIPEGARYFVARSLLTLQNHADLYCVGKNLLALSQQVPTCTDEKRLMDSDWAYQESLAHMARAISATGRRSRSKYVRSCVKSLKNCTLMESQVRSEIVQSLQDQVRAAHILMGTLIPPSERGVSPQQAYVHSHKPRHVFIPPRNYPYRRR